MFKDILLFIKQVFKSGSIQLCGIFAGFFVVPVMLAFGRFSPSSEKPFTVHDGNWIREVFPKQFWAWDNIEDSSTGDHRGWWDANCIFPFFGRSRNVINRFWWLAVRNPFNNYKRYVLGCDIRNYEFELLAGDSHDVRDDFKSTGWQFIKAVPKNASESPRYMFYLVARYGQSNRGLVIQIGNKIKLSHNGAVEEKEIDYWKGFTFEFNPLKDIS